MGAWDQLRLRNMPKGMMCAFTREWKDNLKCSPLLQKRDWYRDCHIIPVKDAGDYIICKVAIMGRITYGGEITTKVRVRFGSSRDRFKQKKIRLPKDMPMNLWDPSD